MILKLRMLTSSLGLVCLCASAAGQATPLTKEEIAYSTRTDDFSIPMPAELMAALTKQGKLNWSAQYRAPIPTDYPGRPQLALNLGGLIADGFVAVEAEDSQQVKNLGKDILKLAKGLGVSKDILMRGSSISDFAERKEWQQLKEELEATENEVKESMRDSKDGDLITLVTAGAWLRGLEVISTFIAGKYNENSAKILRQPEIASYLNRKIDALPDKVKDDPKVKVVRLRLIEMGALVSFPRDKPPTVAEVQKISTLAHETVTEISKKTTK